MATNYKNSFIESFQIKRTIPVNATKTGTLVTAGVKVIGTGTLFTTEAKVGDWIYVAAQNELRRIVSISDNLSLTIDNAFTTPLAGGVFVLTPKSDLKEITVIVGPGGAAVIDGVSVPASSTWTFDKTQRERTSGPNDFIDPIIVDATGGTTAYVVTVK